MTLIKKLWKPLVLAGLSLSAMGASCLISPPREESIVAGESEEGSLLDGLLSLVLEKGGDLVKENLPTIGDFLCSKVFDYIGIDYSDSFTKSVKEVNEKLKSIENDLKTVIKNQQRAASENVIDAYFNIMDVFTDAVHPIYRGYNALLREEKDNPNMSQAEAKAKEDAFYKNNLKTICFGNGTSTGDLYLQLSSLMEKTVTPLATSNKTLMEHYLIAFEHRWAFNTLSFAPKKEFLGYASANIMEGLLLYTFQNLKEREIYKDDTAQQAVLSGRWEEVQKKSEAAFAYLQKEIKAVEEEEKAYEASNSILHYSSGKTLSRKLFVGGLAVKESNYFTYAYSSRGNRQGNMRFVSVESLNARSFANTIQSDFSSYKANYRKSASCTMSEFLQEAGFTCSNWNNNGLYRGQRQHHQGVSCTNEYWKFYVEYANASGQSRSSYYGGVKYKVFGSPTPQYGSSNNWTFMAFVGSDGYLVGSYETIYQDYGNTTVDVVYSFARRATGYNPDGEKGKVW